VPPCFEAFYREHLRHRTGGRVSSRELWRRYNQWAEKAGQPALSLRDVRRPMENIGHAKRHANGIYYADVVFVDALPDVPDNYPGPPMIAAPEAAALLQRIDQAAGELSAVRAIVARLSDERIAHNV
jgi:hypothetical protein